MSKYKTCFFSPNQSSETIHGVKFIGMMNSSCDIPELYRGFGDISTTMFALPTICLGLFGHRLPERVTMEDIRLHKTTNITDDAHMVSLTTNKQVAKDWGNKNYITLDPVLFRQYVIDVHKTYTYHHYNLPGRMEREAEHVALAVLFCSVKSITLGDTDIKNPFYVAIDEHNQEAIQAFENLYLDYLTLLRTLREQPGQAEEASGLLVEFVEAYLSFYDKFAGPDNPFDKTADELLIHYPEFVTRFLQQADHVDCQTVTFKELARTSNKNLIENHAYGRTLTQATPFNPSQIVTCYDDPWSYSTYE
ncbi:hypothetical protein [Legionella spiritensis]|uniref:hypothetical protein n=1 Tax=Legionella spiritensis TaxID=452 RepID=UPI000F6E370C|nr:hypothetical protein [Legionella spiritensis]VEG91544.1 Uncharacterised protein [Legionella spiritensis]